LIALAMPQELLQSKKALKAEGYKTFLCWKMAIGRRRKLNRFLQITDLEIQ